MCCPNWHDLLACLTTWEATALLNYPSKGMLTSNGCALRKPVFRACRNSLATIVLNYLADAENELTIIIIITALRKLESLMPAKSCWSQCVVWNNCWSLKEVPLVAIFADPPKWLLTFRPEAFETHRRVCTHNSPNTCQYERSNNDPLALRKVTMHREGLPPCGRKADRWAAAQKMPRLYMCYLCGRQYDSKRWCSPPCILELDCFSPAIAAGCGVS